MEEHRICEEAGFGVCLSFRATLNLKTIHLQSFHEIHDVFDATTEKSGCDLTAAGIYGTMVKRLRHRPFTAESRVRFSLVSFKISARLEKYPFDVWWQAFKPPLDDDAEIVVITTALYFKTFGLRLF